MNRHYELRHQQKVANLNLIFLFIYLAFSVSSHLIAPHLISIFNQPVIPSTFTYMACFVLTDVMACYNKKKFMFFVILGEALFNLLVIGLCKYPNHFSSPTFFTYASSYENVFSSITSLYVANLVGASVSSIIDVLIFIYLYKHRNFNFLLSSIASTLTTIIIYTCVTDITWFHNIYPKMVYKLTYINIGTNILSLLVYSLVGQVIVVFVKKYLRGT